MKNKLTIGALALSAFALAACDFSGDNIEWDEEGVWKCHNEFNDKSISFDTAADDIHGTVDFTGMTLMGTDLKTGRKFTMKIDDGWVCTKPSGKVVPFESDYTPS